MTSLTYGDKHVTETDEYRFVYVPHTRSGVLGEPTAKQVRAATQNGNHLMSSEEWRALGVVQSHGWEHVGTYTHNIGHYAFALLFRREIDYLGRYGNVPRTHPAPFLQARAITPVRPAAAALAISPTRLTPIEREIPYHDLALAAKRFRPAYQVHVPSGVVVTGVGSRQHIVMEGEPRQGPVAFPASVVGVDRITGLSRALEPVAMDTINEVVTLDIRWEGGRPFRATFHPNGWIMGGWLVGPAGAPVVEEFIAYHPQAGVVAGDSTDLVGSESKASYHAFMTAFPYQALPDLEEEDEL